MNIYRTEGDDGEWKNITKEEYDELLNKRIDKLPNKCSDELLWTLFGNSSSEKESERRNECYNKLPQEYRDEIENHLINLCQFFENETFWKYNTFEYRQAICRFDYDKIKDVPELLEIANYFKHVLNLLS